MYAIKFLIKRLIKLWNYKCKVSESILVNQTMITKSFMTTIIVNVFIVGIVMYLGLGPLNLWKKVVSSNGDISWFWFSVNMVLLIIIFAFVATSYSMYIKNYTQDETIPVQNSVKPSLQIQMSDNLFDENEIKKPGIIIYDGLITLPFEEEDIIEDIFVTLNFPIMIENFELVKQIGIENPKIQMGNENYFELKEGVGVKGYTNSVVVEIKKVKPSAFFRFKINSVSLKNRDIERQVNYNGYFYRTINGKLIRTDIKGELPFKFYKIAEIDLKQLNILYELLSKSDSKEGTLEFWTSDKNWYERNGFFIDFIPEFKKENFKIHIFRDIDNILKINLSNYYYKNVMLEFRDLQALPQKPSHPSHMIVLTWNKDGNKLYVDGELVDEYPKK